ncbi:phosphoribosyltransferase [Butyricicoccus sp.]|uniref:phosphoribosyltransferase n=1 Tax=Butyricicoccus sp. TaxID=2049021 RepID=UPI003F14638C
MSTLESRIVKYPSKKYSKVVPLKAIPGHFVTNHSHINHYIDLTTIKSRLSEASQCAHILAQQYEDSAIPIDTIVCLDGTDVIGTFLAQELKNAGHSIRNTHQTIYVIRPERTANSQLFFRENVEPMVRGKNVILLMASVTTGISIRRGIECMGYYGGLIRGVATIFSAVSHMDDMSINTVFTSDDIPGYASYDGGSCPYCQKKIPVEAMVNSFGYSKL